MGKRNFYRDIYRWNNFFAKTLFDFEKLIPILVFSGAALFSIAGLSKIKQSLSDLQIQEQAALGYTVFCIVAYGLLFLARRYLVKQSYPYAHHFFSFFQEQNDVIFFSEATKKIVLDFEQLPEVQQNEKHRFALANKDDLDLIVKFHRQSFLNSSWREPDDIVRSEIETQIKKNSHTILFFSDVIGGKTAIVGYSHILPLNSKNYTEFRIAKSKHLQLGGSQIVSIGSNKPDHAPCGMLVVSVNLCEIEKNRISDTDAATSKVIEALAIHFSKYCKNVFKNFENIPILFHSLRPDVDNTFAKFYTQTISKDFAKVYQFDLRNLYCSTSLNCLNSQRFIHLNKMSIRFQSIIIWTSILLCCTAYCFSKF